MPQIILGQPHAFQPYGATELIDGYWGVGMNDCAILTRSIKPGGPTWTTFGTAPPENFGPSGRQLDARAAFGGVYYSPTPTVNANATQSLLFYGTVTAYSGNFAGFLTMADATGANNSNSFQRNGTNTEWNLYVSGGVGASSATDPVLNAARPVCVLLTSSTHWGSSVWVNGAKFLSAAGTGAAVTGCRVVVFGERTASASFASKGTCALRAHWNSRGMTDAEAHALTKNPWRIFQPRLRRYAFGVAGAAATFNAAWAMGNSVIQPGTTNA